MSHQSDLIATDILSYLKSLDKNYRNLKINLWEGINQSDIILLMM